MTAAPAAERESPRYKELSNEEIKRTVTEKVMFYGTLRSGHANHDVMIRSIVAGFSQVGYIRGEVKPTVYYFPCLIEGLGLVEGEVYNVDENALKWLDYFEGTPTLYERRKVAALDKDGNPAGYDVWVYYGTGAKNAIKEFEQ